ncbi:MAG: ABC transporter permease [Simkaniaceae bacterium]|nr:ABC transporter permease [Simkaniaceae bacterium]
MKTSRIFQLLTVIGTYIFLYLPIVILIVFSFNSKPFPAAWDNFTFKWYEELFASTVLWNSFSNSVIIAISSTTLSLLMATLLIYWRAQGGRVKKYIPLFYGNLIVPETVLAVSLLAFFSLFKVPLGLPTLIASHTVIGLGFAIPILYTRYHELDSRLTEASLDLGATPMQTFFRITLPALRPAIIGTGLLVFVISFDDFVISYFCSGSQIQTLSLYIFSMIRSGISPIVNALSAVLLLFSTLLALLFFAPKRKARVLG